MRTLTKNHTYQQLRIRLQEEIYRGKFKVGHRLPTITEIAKLYNVSRDTVLRSVKELVNEGILESRRRHGITVRRMPERRKIEHKRILAIEKRSNGPMLSAAIRNAMSESMPGWQLFETQFDVNKADYNSDTFLNELTEADSHVGYLLLSVPIEVKQYFQARGLPCLVVGELEDGIDLPNVCFDEYARFYQATRHLIECGYKKIAFIQHKYKAPGDYERQAGVMEAFNEGSTNNGLEMPHVIEIDEADEVEGRQIISDFFAGAEMPMGVVSCSDKISCWLLQKASELGISIPEEFGIVTNGSTELPEHMNPQITSLRYDHIKLGFTFGKMLTRVIAGYELEQRHVKIPFSSPYIIPYQTTMSFAESVK